jgi:hypothetical protein
MMTHQEVLAMLAAQREEARLNPSPKISSLVNAPLEATMTITVTVLASTFLEEYPEGTMEEFGEYVRDYAEEIVTTRVMYASILTDTGETIG